MCDDWMMWLVRELWHLAPPCDECRKTVVLCACDFAESVSHMWTDKTRDVCMEAIETARKWTGGLATLEECRNAAERVCFGDHASVAARYAALAVDADHDESSECADQAAEYAIVATRSRRRHAKKNCDVIRKYFPTAPRI